MGNPKPNNTPINNTPINVHMEWGNVPPQLIPHMQAILNNHNVWYNTHTAQDDIQLIHLTPEESASLLNVINENHNN